MGACDFTAYAAKPKAEDAFFEAREQALYDHGHSGYSGTIAEKHEFTVLQREPMYLNEAHTKAYELINAYDYRINDKWGPAGAIPIKDDDDSKPGIIGWLFFGWASS